MKRLLQGEELRLRAVELGVDLEGDPRSRSTSGAAPIAADFELQRRVLEAERARRDSALWVIAVISAVASVLSALAALLAVARS